MMETCKQCGATVRRTKLNRCPKCYAAYFEAVRGEPLVVYQARKAAVDHEMNRRMEAYKRILGE